MYDVPTTLDSKAKLYTSKTLLPATLHAYLILACLLVWLYNKFVLAHFVRSNHKVSKHIHIRIPHVVLFSYEQQI